MPSDSGTVTRVGTRNIQFYIPNDVSTHPSCVFSPEDDFEVVTLPHVGLLLVPPDVSLTVEDVLDALDPYLDESARGDSTPSLDAAGIDRDASLTTTTHTDADGETTDP